MSVTPGGKSAHGSTRDSVCGEPHIYVFCYASDESVGVILTLPKIATPSPSTHSREGTRQELNKQVAL